MTVGKLYHDDVVVYGGALVEAAKLESSVVSTPRVAITERCMEFVRADFSRDGGADLQKNFILDDGSGPFVADMFREVRSALPLRYEHAPHEGAKRKLEWMRDYVNRSVDEHGFSGDFKVSLPKPGCLRQLREMVNRVRAVASRLGSRWAS